MLVFDRRLLPPPYRQLQQPGHGCLPSLPTATGTGYARVSLTVPVSTGNRFLSGLLEWSEIMADNYIQAFHKWSNLPENKQQYNYLDNRI